jgi:citrate lyase beta subunit
VHVSVVHVRVYAFTYNGIGVCAAGLAFGIEDYAAALGATSAGSMLLCDASMVRSSACSMGCALIIT